MKGKPSRTTAHLFAIITIIVWANTFIASKHLLQIYSPVQIIVLRSFLAFVVLFLLRPHILRLPWKEELWMIFFGLSGNTVYLLLENSALQYTLASNVSIIVTSAPILTAILSHFLPGGETLHRRILFGSLISFAGVALVIFNGTVVFQLNPLGDFLSLGAALCWAAYSVCVRKYLVKYDSILVTRRVMFWGFITALPVVLLTDSLPPLAPLSSDPISLLCILFLGIIGSAICYALWNVSFDVLGPVVTNNYIYIQPFFTLLFAAFFLHEPISPMSVCGAVLITIGVILAGKRKAEQN